jgi:hypothetical protein
MGCWTAYLTGLRAFWGRNFTHITPLTGLFNPLFALYVKSLCVVTQRLFIYAKNTEGVFPVYDD